MSKFTLCMTNKCKNWFDCGSNYCQASKTVTEKAGKDTTYLCKNFEATEGTPKVPEARKASGLFYVKPDRGGVSLKGKGKHSVVSPRSLTDRSTRSSGTAEVN